MVSTAAARSAQLQKADIRPIFMKRYLTMAGIILVVGIVLYLEEREVEEESGASRIPSPELTLAAMAMPQLPTNGSFLENVTISYEPVVKIQDTDLQRVSLVFEKNPPPVNLEDLRPRPGNTRDPVLTFADRQLNYELFGAQGFSFKLNFKPGYPNPEALVPSRVDPGLGVSIKF